MQLAAAGEDRPTLRSIADSLIAKASEGDVQAIKEIADRLDGKPAQESTVTTVKHDVTDWSRAELVAVLNDAKAGGNGAAKTNGRGNGSDPLH